MNLDQLGMDVCDPAENIPPDKNSHKSNCKSAIGKLLHEACFSGHGHGYGSQNSGCLDQDITPSTSASSSSKCNKGMSANLVMNVEKLPSIDIKKLTKTNATQVNTSRPLPSNIESNMDHNEFTPSDKEGFQMVQKKRKISGDTNLRKIDLSNSVLSVSNNASGQSQDSSNRFAILGDLDIKTNNTYHKKIPAQEALVVEKSVGNRKSFCPPIFLFGVDMNNLIKDLKARQIVFKIVNKSRHKSKLYLQDPKIHTELMCLLREKKLDSYSYTPRELKRQTIVLRGLLFDTAIEDIKSEIDMLVPDTVHSVSKFSTSYSKKNNIDTGLFLLTLHPGKSVSELKAQRYILHQRVSWELPKKNMRDVQCWRCQQWGHMSQNCNRDFACVKCGQNHAQGECKFVQGDGNLPFCINCGNSGHPSSFRGCPEYKKYVELKKRARSVALERKEKAKNNVFSALNSFTQPNVSYSDASRNGTSSYTQPSTKPKIIEEFLKIAKELCPPKVISLEDKIANFIREFQTISKEEAIQRCIGLLREVNQVYGP